MYSYLIIFNLSEKLLSVSLDETAYTCMDVFVCTQYICGHIYICNICIYPNVQKEKYMYVKGERVCERSRIYVMSHKATHTSPSLALYSFSIFSPSSCAFLKDYICDADSHSWQFLASSYSLSAHIYRVEKFSNIRLRLTYWQTLWKSPSWQS